MKSNLTSRQPKTSKKICVKSPNLQTNFICLGKKEENNHNFTQKFQIKNKTNAPLKAKLIFISD